MTVFLDRFLPVAPDGWHYYRVAGVWYGWSLVHPEAVRLDSFLIRRRS